MVSALFSTAFNTGEPAYKVDGKGVISAWNAAASIALGYKSSEAVGQKCWELLQGKDTFGNQYCSERCPLRQMAFQNKSVNRCRIYFRTVDRETKGFTVTTLVFFGGHEQVSLIHLCRPEPETGWQTSAVPVPRKSSLRAPLTLRESQVLSFLCEGRSTEDIATLMSIAIPTVRNHVEHIMHKLHVHSRLEAVAVARHLNIKGVK